MMDPKALQVRTLVHVMEFLDKHPRLTRIFLRPLANAPVLSDKLMVLARGFMGATAFEIHDVDMEKGRIGIGGVEEIMAGSKIIELLHTTLNEHLVESEKNQALYKMGKTLCTWEVSQAMEHGRWAPSVLVPLMMNARILDQVRTDPMMRRFFSGVMKMMSRLITDEGGWGHLEFELTTEPLRILLSHSQEARWMGPSDKPVCHFYAGIVSGYASTISGAELVSKEVECAAMGAPKCVFELTKA